VILEGVSEGRAALHLGLDGQHHLLEGGVVHLVGEDVEALHQRQARVDHRRELLGEDQDVLAADTRANLRQPELQGLPLHLHRREAQRLQPGVHGARVERLHLALLGLASDLLPRPCLALGAAFAFSAVVETAMSSES
jgi:hypothetical protein